jgi:hypothetical protein
LYWVGDLCYVFGSTYWDEVCALTIVGDDVTEGIFELADGIKFGLLTTCWGDGVYYDLEGHSYPVDAGLIGCVLVSDIPELESEMRVGDSYNGGHIFLFEEEFEIENTGGPVNGWGNKDGILHFGDVVLIDTRQDNEDEEEDDNDWIIEEDEEEDEDEV